MKDRLKNINLKNKNMLFLIAGLCVLVPLSLWLLSGSKEDLSEGFSKVQEKEQVSTEYTPPKLENPFKKQENNISNENNASMDTANLALFAKDEKSLQVEQSLPSLANSNLDQEEAIRQIAKRQKPKDMIAFLKEIQKDIDFNKNKNFFKYELKEYKEKEKLLDFFEIERINANFIRFKDDDYAYNLRFLGE